MSRGTTTSSCPRCGGKRVRKESISNSVFLGIFTVGLILILIWPGFDELFIGWKVAGVMGVILGFYWIWSGVSRVMSRTGPTMKCLDCQYEWPWS